MTRLLVVEDEDRLARAIVVGLQDEGYLVDRARDGEEALWHLQAAHHDAVVLDIRLPRKSGLEVCREARDAGLRIPFIMLTACDTTDDIVRGLDGGADDYLVKPFQFAELLARLRALLRRGSAASHDALRLADLELDPSARSVSRQGRTIALGNLEFRLLELLLRRQGEVLSKARIAAALWDDEMGPESNVLEVLVSNLRRKIDREASCALIHTRRGVGYYMSADTPA
ncbi:MAG: response regulator transcription factor [Planctomycetes bacterium]|nr:response regulator transcription factor [Planctomycetota bacterium]